MAWLKLAFAGILTSACSGGQSGNEGEIPAAPCARLGQQALVRGEIVARAAECVGGETRDVVDVRVDEVVQSYAEQLILLDGGISSGPGWPFTGEVLHGVLGNVYAYRHEFSAGERVAVLVQGPEQPLPSLQLMLLDGDGLRIDWAGVHYTASFADLTHPDCDARELARRNRLPRDRPRQVIGVLPVAPIATCTP